MSPSSVVRRGTSIGPAKGFRKASEPRCPIISGRPRCSLNRQGMKPGSKTGSGSVPGSEAQALHAEHLAGLEGGGVGAELGEVDPEAPLEGEEARFPDVAPEVDRGLEAPGAGRGRGPVRRAHDVHRGLGRREVGRAGPEDEEEAVLEVGDVQVVVGDLGDDPLRERGARSDLDGIRERHRVRARCARRVVVATAEGTAERDHQDSAQGEPAGPVGTGRMHHDRSGPRTSARVSAIRTRSSAVA